MLLFINKSHVISVSDLGVSKRSPFISYNCRIWGHGSFQKHSGLIGSHILKNYIKNNICL